MVADVDRCLHSLTKAANALSSATIPFAVGGGCAVYARGGPPALHDVDLFVKDDDLAAAISQLGRAGLHAEPSTDRHEPVFSDRGVLVNLIARPANDGIFERASWMRVGPTSAYVVTATDVMVESLKVLNARKLDFAELLQVARALREQINWPAVESSTSRSPYARAFLGLVEDFRISTPEVQETHDSDHELSAYVEARLRRSFANDPRAGELGISVSVAGNHVTLTGLVSSPARRAILETIVREHLPDAQIDDQVELVETPEPHDLEEMS